ncbi:Cameo2 [Operophtera brumata]|uniref:Cameo2 n=1 Tax=Operophtera brumata TaxID=104452 RepID=A0A0L7LMY6_OPEBR|nr:Cameo2 [Operophtera brumata]
MQQVVTVGDDVISEIRMVRALADWGGVVCAILALTFATLTAIASCCCTRPKYSKPEDLIKSDRPKDEAELKLNPK